MAAHSSNARIGRQYSVHPALAQQRMDEQDKHTTLLALRFMARRSTLERAALRSLRDRHLGVTTDELARIWVDRLMGRDVHEPTDVIGDDVERRTRDTKKRVDNYLELLAQNNNNEIWSNCLDCTFCGNFFPAFWMLDLMPFGNNDWRNNYFRCCYLCAAGENDDFVWHPEHRSLTAALPGQRGIYIGQPRAHRLPASGSI